MPRLIECLTAVIARVRDELRPDVLIIGGRSMGGRAASMLAAGGFSCDGLLLLAYPLHPAGQPEKLRDAHWAPTGPGLVHQRDTRCAMPARSDGEALWRSSGRTGACIGWRARTTASTFSRAPAPRMLPSCEEGERRHCLDSRGSRPWRERMIEPAALLLFASEARGAKRAAFPTHRWRSNEHSRHVPDHGQAGRCHAGCAGEPSRSARKASTLHRDDAAVPRCDGHRLGWQRARSRLRHRRGFSGDRAGKRFAGQA